MVPSSALFRWQDVWLNGHDRDPSLSLYYPRAPLTVLLQSAAQRFPERPVCTLYGKATTYASLDEQSRRLASALQSMGAGPGRYVGILLPNIPEYPVALQATWLTGATVLQLSPLMVPEEVAHWVEATGCHIVITLDLLAANVMPALGHGPLEHVVLTTLADRMALWRGFLYGVERVRRNGMLYLPQDAHRHPWPLLMKSPILERQPDIVPHEDVAVVAPTGGTTASPKAVMLTHHNLLANAFQMRHYVQGEDGTENVLGVLPFFHSYGLAVSLLATWARAATVHVLPRFETRAVLDLLLKRKPEVVPAVPAMLNALNGLLRKRRHDLSFIRHVISGAMPLPTNVRLEFEGFGAPVIVEGYGLTEASPVTHVNPPAEGNRPGTIGKPLIDTEAKIVDLVNGTEELPDGVPGELVVRGPQVMKGYWNNPLATMEVLREGWLYTGDIAMRDRDGYVTLVDRKKDIIKTSGFLVYPAEVEEVLRTFPGVAEAAVVGVPDVERGEAVKALIVSHPGAKVDLAALEVFCKQHLGKQKRPKSVEVVNELPKNFLGKVLRRKLRHPTVVAGPQNS
jgi:long-chain acyl-CoA synthetase